MACSYKHPGFSQWSAMSSETSNFKPPLPLFFFVFLLSQLLWTSGIYDDCIRLHIIPEEEIVNHLQNDQNQSFRLVACYSAGKAREIRVLFQQFLPIRFHTWEWAANSKQQQNSTSRGTIILVDMTDMQVVICFAGCKKTIRNLVGSYSVV